MRPKSFSYSLLGGAAAAALVLAAAPALAQTSGSGGTIVQNGGTIDPFGGTIDPFGKNVDPFGGNVDPFGRNVDPFGGNVDPFGGNVDPFGGNVDPFGGNNDPFLNGQPLNSNMLGAFWKDFGTGWKSLSNNWNQLASNPNDINQQSIVANSLQTLVAQSESFWGQRVAQRTGKNFRDGFANALIAKYGLSFGDPASFARLSSAKRARFIFEWYDGLNAFTGIDQVDHWMKTVRWNPNLTLVQGSGSRSLISIIDGAIAIGSGLTSNVMVQSGYQNKDDGHGSAVLGLIVGAHDGRSIQGIAPQARVVAYNPFDATRTAAWSDIRNGVTHAQSLGASVINMSLGERGFAFSPGWQAIFADPLVRSGVGRSVYVLSAGNDGISQTTNVAMDGTGYPAMVVVGSTDPNGVISSFSNRPGTACLTVGGICSSGSRLMDRFLVAPGEMILVSDGNGGVTRVSGTSFAAPLVSGAITLLHNRWPWLVNYPLETTDIVLRSARDLGTPGVDAVYGRGMLDVEASQSPLNFNNLVFYEVKSGSTKRSQLSVNTVRTRVLPKNYELDGLFYYAIENIGATRRDFAIPLASRLFGGKTTISGASEYFQDFVARRMNSWIKTGSSTGLTDAETITSAGPSGFRMSYSLFPASQSDARSGKAIAMTKPNMRVASANNRFGFSMGHGDGSRALLAQPGFGLSGDYEAAAGGINPILGLASGGAYFMGDAKLGKNATLSFGYTQSREAVDENVAIDASERASLARAGVADYAANAFTVKVDYQPQQSVNLSLSYARVDEANAIHGVQSLSDGDFNHGARTHTATLGAKFAVKSGLSLSASTTMGVTRSLEDDDRSITTAGKGVVSTSFAVAATKKGVFGSKDALRISLAQPLKVKKGELEFRSVEIVDRNTGELGERVHKFSIANRERRYTGEFVYATPISSKGQFSLFGRADYFKDAENGRSVDGMVIGGRLSMPF